MAAVTFGALKEQIQAEVNRPSTTNLDFIGNAIVTAIRYWEWHPVWFTETTTTLTLAQAATTVSLPSDFKRLGKAQLLVSSYYRSEGSGFDSVTMDELWDNWTDPNLTQTPVQYALCNNTLYFDCIADQEYTLRMLYNYGDSTYPSADGDTSVWFDQGVDVIRLHASSIFYADRMHDFERAAACKAQADDIYNNLLQRNNNRKASNRLNA